MPSVAETGPRGGARHTLQQYVDGVLSGDRVLLARAITLVESRLPADADLSAQLLDALLPHTGKTRRLGITGVPGVGKSTLIDALGIHVTRDRGERLAVLSVDPSSAISGGSILGDKTRMERLARDQRAFIRPSPAGGFPGGVAWHTREAILLCEAAGYRNIFIETLGVGQSESAVHAISDFFLLLMLAGAGDELQGIKRGIVERVDVMAINKADGDNKASAERARTDYASALQLLRPSSGSWHPRVVCCSAVEGTGIRDIWEMVLEHEAQLEASGERAERRVRGELEWLHQLVSNGIAEMLAAHTGVAGLMAGLEEEVRSGRTTPLSASRTVLQRLSESFSRR